MKHARSREPALPVDTSVVDADLDATPGAANGSAVHVVWTVPLGDSISISNLYRCLVGGQESKLFDIQSWDCRDGQVNAVLEPQAPLEDIVAVLWGTGREPAGLWLENRRHTGSPRCN